MLSKRNAIHLFRFETVKDMENKKMKAIICTKYGPPEVLQLQEVEKPTPKDNQVLIKIHATTAFMGDCEMRGLRFSFMMRFLMRLAFGFRGPRKKILGQELAGEIESIGNDVKLFKKGDQVFATTGFVFGGYAEYVCLPEDGVISIKPTNITFEEAAAVPVGGTNALYFIKKGDIKKGQKVLIIGAGGSIGTMGVQLAKYYGAEVTAVDSTKKLDMLRSIGADHVVDYTQEDYSKNEETYDVIFDVAGKSSFSGSKRVLKKKGILLLANPRFSHVIRGLWTKMASGKNVISGGVVEKSEDLVFLKELIEAGKIKSVIDRRYPLEQIVEAHRYVDTGQKAGNVVINVVKVKAFIEGKRLVD